MRVLIVEDEEPIAEAIKKRLETEGFAVDYVLDGETAQNRLESSEKDYDLVVLDLMLPKKDGFQVCKAMRERGIKTPVLVLTARDTLPDKVNALGWGADDYLIKPFSFEELSARIRALLRRPNELLPTELKLGDLTLNPAVRKVYLNNREVGLTLKEFSLLEYFMRHPNKVLNREQLLDHIWNFDFRGFSNVIDVYIKNLRKKLDLRANSKTTLETIRGVGYILKHWG